MDQNENCARKRSTAPVPYQLIYKPAHIQTNSISIATISRFHWNGIKKDSTFWLSPSVHALNGKVLGVRRPDASGQLTANRESGRWEPLRPT